MLMSAYECLAMSTHRYGPVAPQTPISTEEHLYMYFSVKSSANAPERKVKPAGEDKPKEINSQSSQTCPTMENASTSVCTPFPKPNVPQKGPNVQVPEAQESLNFCSDSLEHDPVRPPSNDHSDYSDSKIFELPSPTVTPSLTQPPLQIIPDTSMVLPTESPAKDTNPCVHQQTSENLKYSLCVLKQL